MEEATTAKQYLLQLPRLKVMIDQKLEEKESLRASLGSMSIDYTSEQVRSGLYRNQSFFAEKISKIVDLESEIDSMLLLFIEKQHEIVGKIHLLTDIKYIQLLFKRYVENKRFEQISEEMFLDYNYVRRLHFQAVDSFQKTNKNLHF